MNSNISDVTDSTGYPIAADRAAMSRFLTKSKIPSYEPLGAKIDTSALTLAGWTDTWISFAVMPSIKDTNAELKCSESNVSTEVPNSRESAIN